MYLKSVRIENYKCFRESTHVELAPGVNVIVGRNNVGKSAVVEAMSLTFGNRPHRSERSAPRASTMNAPQSKVAFEIVVTAEEVAAFLRSRHGPTAIPASINVANDERDARKLVKSLTLANGILKGLRTDGLPTFDDTLFMGIYNVSQPGDSSRRRWHTLDLAANSELHAWSTTGVENDPPHRLDLQLYSHFLESCLYAFRAERMNVGGVPVRTQPYTHARRQQLAGNTELPSG